MYVFYCSLSHDYIKQKVITFGQSEVIHWIKPATEFTFFNEHKRTKLVISSISFYGHYKSDEVLIECQATAET